MSKYRFKTEEEFKRDGLWNKNRPFKWVSVMNKYLGQDIPDKYNQACDKQEKFRYDQWHIEPHDYILKETSFVLPSKWCIKVDRDCQPEEVYKWRDMSWVDAGYINYTGEWTGGIKHNHTEITLEQFKQHMLKESPVVETTKEIDMKDIQEEAKKRFPIGCKFMNTSGDGPFTLKEESYAYDISGMNIWAHYGVGCLYENGEWATLVSSPETKKEMFYEGDYIVTLDAVDGYNCARKNYCFKQRITNKGIYPTVDLQGITSNGHSVMSFDKKQWLKDWRYATPEEAAEYERIGKPYDVTTLQKKEESIPEYVECINRKIGFTVGKIYNWPNPTDDDRDIRMLIEFDGYFKPSTKEAYDAQFVFKSTVIEEWSEGTYAVGIKGGFGLYSESEKPVGLGKIYTIEQNRGTTIAVKESSFWVSRENLRWFATHEEALAFSRRFITNPVPKESDYPVMPKDAYPSIKKETFIDNVQSVDVMLRTKRKSIKF